ncbi:MAG: hypothetical protein V1660_00145 [archaeon]
MRGVVPQTISETAKMALPKQDILDKIEKLDGKEVNENWLRYNQDFLKGIYEGKKELKIFISKSSIHSDIHGPLEKISFFGGPHIVELSTRAGGRTIMDYEMAKFSVSKGIGAEYKLSISERIRENEREIPGKIDLVYSTGD